MNFHKLAMVYNRLSGQFITANVLVAPWRLTELHTDLGELIESARELQQEIERGEKD